VRAAPLLIAQIAPEPTLLIAQIAAAPTLLVAPDTSSANARLNMSVLLVAGAVLLVACAGEYEA